MAQNGSSTPVSDEPFLKELENAAIYASIDSTVFQYAGSDAHLRLGARAQLAERILSGDLEVAKWVLLNLKDE